MQTMAASSLFVNMIHKRNKIEMNGNGLRCDSQMIFVSAPFPLCSYAPNVVDAVGSNGQMDMQVLTCTCSVHVPKKRKNRFRLRTQTHKTHLGQFKMVRATTRTKNIGTVACTKIDRTFCSLHRKFFPHVIWTQPDSLYGLRCVLESNSVTEPKFPIESKRNTNF